MKAIMKYLPADGKIEIGKMTNKGRIMHQEDEKIIGKMWYCKTERGLSYESGGIFPEKHLQFMKPFAVTQDIKVGDEITYTGKTRKLPPIKTVNIGMVEMGSLVQGVSKIIVTEEHIKRGIGNNFYKVLGEISSGAIWVEDGNEYDMRLGKYFILRQYKADLYYVKCSQCNTYH